MELTEHSMGLMILPARAVESMSIMPEVDSVMLSRRGTCPGCHWASIPTNTPNSHLWRTTNREGGWKLDRGPSKNVPYSLSLVLAHKVGFINNWQTYIDTLNGIPARHRPSPDTRETFSCKTWVKDASIALEKAGIISVDGDISAVEAMLIKEASTIMWRKKIAAQ
ncbi:hypothetical protein H109_04314, partial [Trichophyton interdigitale MR816]